MDLIYFATKTLIIVVIIKIWLFIFFTCEGKKWDSNTSWIRNYNNTHPTFAVLLCYCVSQYDSLENKMIKVHLDILEQSIVIPLKMANVVLSDIAFKTVNLIEINHFNRK